MCLHGRTSPIAIAVGMAAILVVAAGCGSTTPTASQTESPATGVPTLTTLRAFSFSLDGSLLAGTGNEALPSSGRGGSWSTARLPQGRSVLDGLLTASGEIVVVSTDRADQNPAALADIFIDRSVDHGATWMEELLLMQAASVTPSIDAMAEGRIGVLLAPSRQAERASTLSVSPDDGTTWSTPITFEEPPLLGPLGVSSEALAAVAAVPWAIPAQPGGLAVSRDAGATWSITDFPAPEGFAAADEIAVSRPASIDGTSFRVAVAYASDEGGVVEVVECRDTSCDAVGLVTGRVEDGDLLSVAGDDVFVEVGAVLWHSADGGMTW